MQYLRCNEQRASASSEDATDAQQTAQEISTLSTAKAPLRPLLKLTHKIQVTGKFDKTSMRHTICHKFFLDIIGRSP